FNPSGSCHHRAIESSGSGGNGSMMRDPAQRTKVMRWWVAALAWLVLAAPNVAADPLDGHDCFSSDNESRIRGCTELIERSGVGGQLLSSAYAMRALGYSLMGLYDTAIRDYDEAIRLTPDFAVALNNRAWAYFKSGRPDAGLPDVER